MGVLPDAATIAGIGSANIERARLSLEVAQPFADEVIGKTLRPPKRS